MRTNYLWIGLLILLVLDVNVYAQEDHSKMVVKPFGTLVWDDTLVDVFEKLNKMDGVEKIEFNSSRTSKNLKGLAISSLAKELFELTLNSSGGLKPKKKKEEVVMHFPGSCFKYLDINGNERMSLRSDLQFTAYPVIIEGVPFKLMVYLTPIPGISISKPNKIIGYSYLYFPFIIKRVTLISNSPALKDKKATIDALIKQKYGAGSNRDELSNGKFWDNERNSIFLQQDDYSCKIYYESGGKYARELIELYRKHLSDLETKSLGNKKDMKQGL